MLFKVKIIYFGNRHQIIFNLPCIISCLNKFIPCWLTMLLVNNAHGLYIGEHEQNHQNKNCPGWHRSVSWSFVPYTGRFQVPFLARAHTQSCWFDPQSGHMWKAID